MSSAIWDWVAILTDLRPADGTFVPLYWTIPARLALGCGLTPPTPGVAFSIPIAASVLAIALFLWKRQRAWLFLAGFIWGALLADTPYVILVPPLLVLVWNVPLAIARQFGFVPRWESHRPKWRLGTFFLLLALVLTGFVNLIRFRAAYPSGYVRRAVAAVRWDGLGWSPGASRMDELLTVYVNELARAGEGRKWIFTDGLCDSGIELAAQGRLRAVSLVGGRITAEDAQRDGFTNREDLFSLEGGAAQLLRAWAVDRPAELTNAVFQCGFSFLDEVAPGRVEPCGLVMRPVDSNSVPRAAPAPDGNRAWEAVRDLAARIVAYREKGHWDVGIGRVRAVRFGAMQWRVARAIRREAQVLDRAGRAEEARKAVALSERLDELNPFARNRTDDIESVDRRAFNAFSPREGLAFALKRADFSLARRYAKPILADEPDNPAANFALAMGHFQMKEYALARGYFEKALAARPDDPAILNNLAMTLVELGEIDAAESYARTALERSPGSPAIRSTLRRIERIDTERTVK